MPVNIRFGVEALLTPDMHVFSPHGKMDTDHGRREEGQETDPALICPQGVTDFLRKVLPSLFVPMGGRFFSFRCRGRNHVTHVTLEHQHLGPFRVTSALH